MDWYRRYLGSRNELLALLEAHDPATSVRACPGWSALDVVRHVISVAEDYERGSTADNLSPIHTAAAVDARAERDLVWLATEWNELTARIRPHLEALEPDPGRWPAIIVTDLVVHVHDVRNALRVPDHADPNIEVATGQLIKQARVVLAGTAAPSFVISVPGVRDWIVGRGAPTLSLTSDLWSLFRAISGRRTRAEAAAMQWSADPTQVLDHWLSVQFAYPEGRLGE